MPAAPPAAGGAAPTQSAFRGSAALPGRVVTARLREGWRNAIFSSMDLTKEAAELLYGGLTEEEFKARPTADFALIEQYKLYVMMADRISDRRQAANSFFLAVNSGILTVMGYATIKDKDAIPLAIVWMTALAGMLVSILWLRLVLSYRNLNTAKFLVIHGIERLLPLRPYDAEWELVGRGERRKFYFPLTHIERLIPLGFVLLHLVFATFLTALVLR
ncbi:MAG TPA: hypothetical protein VHE78_10205 [Gemmatimonadaceae bacterium]|nr:hypothetical protein [Gemmatimonadaceae bacterium]